MLKFVEPVAQVLVGGCLLAGSAVVWQQSPVNTRATDTGSL